MDASPPATSPAYRRKQVECAIGVALLIGVLTVPVAGGTLSEPLLAIMGGALLFIAGRGIELYAFAPGRTFPPAQVAESLRLLFGPGGVGTASAAERAFAETRLRGRMVRRWLWGVHGALLVLVLLVSVMVAVTMNSASTDGWGPIIAGLWLAFTLPYLLTGLVVLLLLFIAHTRYAFPSPAALAWREAKAGARFQAGAPPTQGS
jgi:hypothetical protein